MGYFKDAAIRLGRNAWTSAQALSEELRAIFNADKGMTLDGPLTINNRTDQSPLTINQFGPSDLGIQIIRRTPPEAPQYPDNAVSVGGVELPGYSPFGPTELAPGSRTILTIGPSGDITLVTGSDTGVTVPPSPVPPQNAGEPQEPQGGGGTPGVVLSGGPGASYQVRIYPDGLSSAGEVVSVTQLQIAADATVPAGTWAVVTQAGGSYYMQVPVWLGEDEE